MGVAELAAGLVKLEPRAAGEPNCRNALVVEGGRKFVQARKTLATCGDQRINCDEQYVCSLAQTRLRYSEVHSIGIPPFALFQTKEKGGQNLLPALRCVRRIRPE